jgi:hypothetical protein
VNRKNKKNSMNIFALKKSWNWVARPISIVAIEIMVEKKIPVMSQCSQYGAWERPTTHSP